MRRLSKERSLEKLDGGRSDIKTRLTFRDDDSPVAGSSNAMVASGTSLAITPIPKNKEEVKLHVSSMIKQLKSVRKQEKRQDKNEMGLDMSWEQMEHAESPLPQRPPRSSKPRTVANVQLVPPREEAKSDTERYLSPSVKGNESRGKSRRKKAWLERRGDERERHWMEVINKRGKDNRKEKGTGLTKEQGKIEPKSTPSLGDDKRKKA